MKSPRRRTRATAGQLTLIGDIFQHTMKYQPHREVSPTGEAVVILRLPKEATILERLESHKEAQRLSGATKMVLKRDFWFNKARDERRQQGLREIVD